MVAGIIGCDCVLPPRQHIFYRRQILQVYTTTVVKLFKNNVLHYFFANSTFIMETLLQQAHVEGGGGGGELVSSASGIISSHPRAAEATSPLSLGRCNCSKNGFGNIPRKRVVIYSIFVAILTSFIVVSNLLVAFLRDLSRNEQLWSYLSSLQYRNQSVVIK